MNSSRRQLICGELTLTRVAEHSTLTPGSIDSIALSPATSSSTALIGAISDAAATSYAMLASTTCLILTGWIGWSATPIPVRNFNAAIAGVHSR